MLRIIVFVAIVLNVVYAAGFLLSRKARTREHIWVPLVCIAGALELSAIVTQSGPAVRNSLIGLGALVAIVGVLLSRKSGHAEANGSADH